MDEPPAPPCLSWRLRVSLGAGPGGEAYEVRVPGPDDLWLVVQHGGEQSPGTVGGYGSEHLRHLVAVLLEAIPVLEQREAEIEKRRADFFFRNGSKTSHKT